VSEKLPIFYILKYSAKNETILTIFGVQHQKEILHKKIIN